MNAARRNYFLDHRTEESYIFRQLNKLKDHALRHGHAIGIGHPHPETAYAIRDFVRCLDGSTTHFVHVSQIVDL